MNGTSRRGRRLAAWIAAAGCAFWMLAQAAPADAQASRTRPGGGGGGSSSSSSGGGGGSSASSGGGGGSHSSGGPTSVTRSRPSPPSSGGSQTVIENRRPSHGHGGHGGHGGHDHHGGYYGSWGWPYYGGWWGWSWWYPWGWPYYYGSYGSYGYPGYGYYPPAAYAGEPGTGYGALDTDIWPARTQIWIDGKYVGFVDQFDGFPRYLWLADGTYDVVFYHEGFETLARQYSVYPGLVIDVEDRLERGDAIHPSELAPKETPRRDARIEEERQRQAEIEEPEWRARLRAESEAAGAEAEEAEEAEEAVEEVEAPAPEVRAGDARLYLRITPSDAAVYLDGRFLGTAREVTDADSGIAVTPGRHELSVVRPGYDPERLDFEAESAGNVDLGVDLEPAG